MARAVTMASSGCRMAPDGSGTQHKESKGITEDYALDEDRDPNWPTFRRCPRRKNCTTASDCRQNHRNTSLDRWPSSSLQSFSKRGRNWQRGRKVRGLLIRINKTLRDRTGQGMTEYILIVVLVAILAIFSIRMFGGKVGEAARRAGDAVTNGSCCTGHPPYVGKSTN